MIERDLSFRTIENGETPIDLFFRTWLFPFSWESQHKKLEALQLRNSIKEIYHSPKNVEEFKLYRRNMAEINSRDEEDFFRASDFLDRFECLLTVARFGNDNTEFRNLLSEEILSILAVLPWCPKDVAHLALCLYPPDENLLSFNKKQNPLHVWADSMSKQSFVQQQRSSGLLEILTQTISKEVLSEAASCQSANGRSPLHVALSLGRPWRDISILYDANPSMLQKLDTVYKIPVFCLPAIVSIDDKQVELIAKKRDGQCGVWRYLRKSDRASIKKEIRVTLETQTLNVVYQLLRKDPSAIKI